MVMINRQAGRVAGVTLAAFALAQLAAACPVSAQEAGVPAAPPRLDNIYGGFDHQPTEAETQSLERQDGDAPTPKQNKTDAEIVDKLYKQLEGAPPDGTVPAPTK
jgi:hypothetical protein